MKAKQKDVVMDEEMIEEKKENNDDDGSDDAMELNDNKRKKDDIAVYGQGEMIACEDETEPNKKEARLMSLEVNDDAVEQSMKCLSERMIAADNVDFQELDPEEVRKARAEEVEFLKAKGIFQEVDYDECKARTGRCPSPSRTPPLLP
jgi:hypothetical protein